MKNVTYFFILFLLTLTTPLFADKNSNEEVLKRLDRVIDNKTACHVQKEKEIVDLKQRLHRSKDNREKYELCGSLFVSIRPRACFSPSYNKVKSQTKHVWLLTLL